MKKKSFIVFLFVALLFSSFSFLVKGETTTETVLEEYDIVFEWGYVYYFSEKTPAEQTEVTLEISSDQTLLFFVSDEGDAENYADGEEIDVYYVNYNVLVTTLSFVLDEKRSYDFAFDNTNSEGVDANISYAIIRFTYEVTNTSSNWIVWVIIIAAVVGLVVLIIVKRSKQTPVKYAPPPQYSSYDTSSTVHQTYQQPVTPSKYCTNCGATNEENAMFCTNCGAKLT
ncbi:MAG: zinc ribbon domain-containing protein [Candidatus Heimdallarchaeaceae archaeon]